MHPSVRAGWIAFTKPLEGGVDHGYLDIKGLVTIAYGSLVDPAQHALSLPLLRKDGSPASQREIAAEWISLKARSCWATAGARPADMADNVCPWKGTGQICLAHLGAGTAKQFCNLHLDEEGMAKVALGKFDDFAGELARRFPDIDDWPADAQLATMSMAWACGPWFRFPALVVALQEKDFARAVKECTINPVGNPGIPPRNVANKRLYMNAERVRDWKLDPTELQWPAVLEDAVPTQPELPPSEDDGPVMVPPEFPPRDIDTED